MGKIEIRVERNYVRAFFIGLGGLVYMPIFPVICLLVNCEYIRIRCSRSFRWVVNLLTFAAPPRPIMVNGGRSGEIVHPILFQFTIVLYGSPHRACHGFVRHMLLCHGFKQSHVGPILKLAARFPPVLPHMTDLQPAVPRSTYM